MKTKLRAIFVIALIFNQIFASAQNDDSLMVRKIYESALKSEKGYENLRYLTKKIGPRLAGTPQAASAIEWAYQELKDLNYDTVYLQETKVVRWKRGNPEVCNISSLFGHLVTNCCALGGSVGTKDGGVLAEVVEVSSIEELKTLGEKNVKGKIVFYNCVMDNTVTNAFFAYGKVAGIRVHGASEAARLGAIGVVVRSLSLSKNDYPHTGIMRYDENVEKIPAIAISTNDAEVLSKWHKKDSSLKIFMEMNCEFDGEEKSFNVIGEMKGTEKPNEIITVGAHIDSWDNTEGANDDGSGCIHAMDVIRIFKDLKLAPKHTIRCVLFIDEEFAQRGGDTYAETVKAKGEKHIVAIESDEGGSSPIGFSVDSSEPAVKALKQWSPIFKPYGLYLFSEGWGGVDIDPLKKQGIPLIGLTINSQRYFDYHHAPNDTFETVSIRELQLGCGSLAALTYLIDKYEFEVK